MADRDADLRNTIEGLIGRVIDAEAAQRGWDLGPQAQGAQLSTSGAGLNDDSAVVFSTGYDGTITTVGFTFGISLFGGDDILL